MLDVSGAANIHDELVDAKHGGCVCANRSLVDNACHYAGDMKGSMFPAALRTYTYLVPGKDTHTDSLPLTAWIVSGAGFNVTQFP